MPELPDLEVICSLLQERIIGLTVNSVEILRPIVVRNLLPGSPWDHLIGRSFAGVRRRGKYLILELEEGVLVAIQPMLVGRIRHGEPLARTRKRDVLVLGLSDGSELRYHDAKDMGKIYLTDALERIPAYADQGPEATDPEMTLDVFAERLRRQRGEVKSVLTRQSFLAGIGNAYADEILWHAGIYPFRRVSSLSSDEVARLHGALREVLATAIATIGQRIGGETDVEVRDWLSVHGRAGEPCPRCRGAISEVKRERRSTHFCRTCQPGLMVGGAGHLGRRAGRRGS